MNKEKIIGAVVILIGIVAMFFAVNFENVFAASKALETEIDSYNIWRCYNSGQITKKVDVDTFGNVNYLFTNKPFAPEIGTNFESCQVLMDKYLSDDYYYANNIEDKYKILEYLGYTSTAGKCYQLTIGYEKETQILNSEGRVERTVREPGELKSDKICTDGDSYRVERVDDYIVGNDNGKYKGIFFDYDQSNNSITIYATVGDSGYETKTASLNDNGGDLRKTLGQLSSFAYNLNYQSLGNAGLIFSNGGIHDSGGGEVYELLNTDQTGKSIAKKLTGSDVGSLSKVQKRDLYEDYLLSSSYYFAKTDCTSKTSPGNDYVETVLSRNGKATRCFVLATKMQGDRVNGVNGNGYFVESKTWQDVAKELYDDWKDQIGEDVEEEMPTGETEGDEETTADADCQSSGAAGSLGWIVCPVLNWMTNASEFMYDTWIKDLLSVNPQLFTSGDDGTRGAWTAFQSFANIIFVIILLIVIFSQITGLGIDNYGIKKILPKLIIAAILVNLSYYICLIAVDVSNIAGNGFQALFDGLPVETVDQIEGIAVNTSADGFVGVSVLVALVGGVWTVFAGMELPIILLTLFSSAIGVVVSILFLFIMLSVRQAIIVVLTVLSPIAVVLYILPNSKQWFNRYLKMFGALLLLYPLCGLTVGGGNYVSRLLLSSGFAAQGITAAFTAIIIGVAPIFLIPTLLRNSLNAIGGLGGRLSGISSGLSRGATRGIRDSDGYRAMMGQATKARNRALAGIDADGRPTRMGRIRAGIASTRLGRLVGYQGLQSARIAQANKDRESDIQASAELGELTQRYDRAHGNNVRDEQYFTDALNDAVASGDQNRIFSVIEQMRRSNMQQSKMASITRGALGGNELTNALGDQRQNFLNEFAKKYGGDFLKKDFEQADWARKGGINSAGSTSTLGVGGQWAAHEMNVDDMKDEDVAALSSDRLYDLIASGRISQAQAQRVWASNLSMDDTNRLIMGAYGNEGMYLTKSQAQAEITGNGTMGSEKVAAYTERAPGDVVVRDVRWKNKEGQHQQTDPLKTTNENNYPNGIGA